MASAHSRALQSKRWTISATTIVTGSMNIFMGTTAQGSAPRIRLGGPAWSQNSSSNKASTERSPNPIHSRTYEVRRNAICALPVLCRLLASRPVSEEIAGNGLDVTLREFVSGQKLFNRYRL